jgi:hypothetical protein
MRPEFLVDSDYQYYLEKLNQASDKHQGRVVDIENRKNF